MPTRDSAVLGAPCWIELFTSDHAASKAFYSELFGLEVGDPDPDLGGYFNLTSDGRRVSGGMGNDGSSGAPDTWWIYLAVDDLDRAVAAAEEGGGTVVAPPMDVMDLGRAAVITDPGGALVGAWQPGTHHGFEVWGEPGTPAWFELHTRVHPEAVAWYEAVFGSTTQVASDTDDFRYTMIVDGDEQLAGIMDATPFPDDAPLGWSIYWTTPDLDATLAQVQELGGTVVLGPDETPYGRLAGCVDPTGIAFKLQQPPEG